MLPALIIWIAKAPNLPKANMPYESPHGPGDPARANDAAYQAHRHALSAREFMMMTYGFTHFDPETYLPSAKGDQIYCETIREMQRFAERP